MFFWVTFSIWFGFYIFSTAHYHPQKNCTVTICAQLNVCSLPATDESVFDVWMCENLFVYWGSSVLCLHVCVSALNFSLFLALLNSITVVFLRGSQIHVTAVAPAWGLFCCLENTMTCLLLIWPGGLRPRPVVEIPMATPPWAAATTRALVKAATAAPLKGEFPAESNAWLDEQELLPHPLKWNQPDNQTELQFQFQLII